MINYNYLYVLVYLLVIAQTLSDTSRLGVHSKRIKTETGTTHRIKEEP